MKDPGSTGCQMLKVPRRIYHLEDGNGGKNTCIRKKRKNIQRKQLPCNGQRRTKKIKNLVQQKILVNFLRRVRIRDRKVAKPSGSRENAHTLHRGHVCLVLTPVIKCGHNKF